MATYNCPGNCRDESNKITTDSLGNVYVTGYSYGSGTSYDYDYATIKYNNAGVEQWVARYNGPGLYSDYANAIAVDSSGNVYVTGESDGDYATIKYNSMGVEQWVTRYSDPDDGLDQARAIVVDYLGNVYVTGNSDGLGTNYDYATIKYNSTGIVQWVARYNRTGITGNGDDYPYAISLDNSGNVYVTGSSWDSVTSWDYTTIKYNKAGVEKWVARYNGPGNSIDSAKSIAIDGLGNVYVTGESASLEVYPDNYDYATIKYNYAGIEQWVVRYNGPGNGNDSAKSITIDSWGNVYVTGESIDSLTGNDYTTIKYNSTGIEQWVTRYNGPGNVNDWAYAILLDSSGNVYVTGESATSGTYPYNWDYATVKYNNDGVEQWVARYNGTGNDRDTAKAIDIDDIGNIYVTGMSISSETNEDYTTIKYNNAGIEQWVKKYKGPGNGPDRANAIALDCSGNVFVTGRGCILGRDTYYYIDYLTIKYNNAGEEQWVAKYNGPNNGNSYDEAYAIVTDSSGNVYVTGQSRGLGTSDDYATIKYNSTGEEQWVARYNGPENQHDVANAIAIDSSGNVYVTGESANLETYPYNNDFATIKYDSEGIEQWVTIYDGPGSNDDGATAIAIDKSGDIYVTGYSTKNSGIFPYTPDYITIKYNSAGVEQWVARYDGPGNQNDVANAIAIDSSGSVYVTGSSVGSETQWDYATIKYNGLGVEQWVARYDGLGNRHDGANAIVIDSSGNIYVTGESETSGTYPYGWDYLTIKYSQNVSVNYNYWNIY